MEGKCRRISTGGNGISTSLPGGQMTEGPVKVPPPLFQIFRQTRSAVSRSFYTGRTCCSRDCRGWGDGRSCHRDYLGRRQSLLSALLNQNSIIKIIRILSTNWIR
ncbi:hypothetical protein CEXT_483981 [Caerostris extrusa]|uniref:Uncharacterized protein n=1 Tax=Caerostris extrusa TaxID=172846 RepID=A0AAV4PKF3_CAEEX|nr:hypothetical protein CEXT_483981 [Caerostris extrusa]